MKALTYRLKLLEPLLISQIQTGDENSAQGFSFIPGSVIRGMLIGRYLQETNEADPAGNPVTRARFFDGTICYLNAYPAPQKERLLPQPLSWFTEKDNSKNTEIFDLAVAPESVTRLEHPQAAKKEKFCRVIRPDLPDPEDESAGECEPTTAYCYTPPHQISIHISVDDPNIRRKGTGTVYRYDALAAGESFSGAILAPEAFDLQPLRHSLETNPEFFIGKAHTAGYGRIRLEAITEIENWQEFTAGEAPNGKVIVTLLSDAVLRGPNGQVDADLDHVLADLLNLENLKAEARYFQTRLMGGFNKRWGLPLVQSWILRAGSVAVYSRDQVDPDRLRMLTAEGIGERRAEGFGRIAVNWPGAAELSILTEIPKTHPLKTSPELSEESRKLAEFMARRKLQARLEQGLIEFLNGVRIEHAPENAQLSRVRNAAKNALALEDLTQIKAHLEGLKGARSQFERARVDQSPMLKWIEARLEKQNLHEQLLQGKPLPSLGGVRAEITPELAVQYTARMIDGVMEKAIHQNQREETRKGEKKA